MRDQIKTYLDRIFAQAPCTQKAIDMKEAILADVLEKYDDMIADGMKPQDAYQRAISGIGDLDRLIADLRREQGSEPPPKKPEPIKFDDDEKENARRTAYRSIRRAMNMLIVVIYILISFATSAWHITWVIFLIGAAINNIVAAIFDLTGGNKK